jgi:hypothetical protein
MVTDPTRERNILDLFIVNNITLIKKVQVLPGISDHEAVLVEGDITPIINKQPKRQVPLYKKADWEQLKEHVRDFTKGLDMTNRQVNINTLWLNFKLMLESGIKKFIPHREAKRKDGVPWLTLTIKKLIAKRDKLYANYKRYSNDQNFRAFKAIKAAVQKQLRPAYWTYVQDMVNPETGNGDPQKGTNKKFWTYIKHCKRDRAGIAPLLGEDGKLVDNAEEKAEILNKQFTSVFRKVSPHTDLSNLKPTSPHSSMPDHTITVNGVTKLL